MSEYEIGKDIANLLTRVAALESANSGEMPDHGAEEAAATGRYISFVIPQRDSKIRVSGEINRDYGYKLKQSPEGYMQFKQIGFDANGDFVVEVVHLHVHGRTNHRFQLQLYRSNSPTPNFDPAPVTWQRGDSEYS